jgi:predicted lipoprotein with Yx(FWY)xxD motif
MKRSLFATSALAGVALLAAACGGTASGYGAGTTPPSVAGAAAPSVTAPNSTATTLALGNSTHGQILVDGQGRSLYLFEADSNGKSTCTSAACTAEWPPWIVSGTPQAGAGLAANELGTTSRADGRQQVTYGGHPLYYFAGDAGTGSSGQGLNDNGGLWYVLHSDGTAVVN